MAAGRVDVARRVDIDYFREKRSYESVLSRGLDRNSDRRNVFHPFSGSARARVSEGGGRDYKVGEISSQGKYGDSLTKKPGVRGDEISEVEDDGSGHTVKRRKILPVVWDRVDKEVRILSKNRIVTKSSPLCSSPSPAKLSGKSKSVSIHNDLSRVSVGTNQHVGQQISPVESCDVVVLLGNSKLEDRASSPSLNEGPVQVVDKECAEVRHISKSRWAYEGDSPPQVLSSSSGCISSRRRVEVDTPESGEFFAENSEGIRDAGSDYSDAEVNNHDILKMDERDDEDFSTFEEPADPKPRCFYMLQGCRSVSEYENLGKISEGTYGVVYKARHKETGAIMALKKVKKHQNETEGFPMTALREINLLLALHHPSIVNVREVVMDGLDDVFMVMEYMEYDLKRLIEVLKQSLSEKEVKCLMQQLLEGIACLHDNWILHRDLKTSNLLISDSGRLKICDFGMARQYGSPLKPYTSSVVTLWYRAPELLLGAKKYSTAVDMWSVGCIMAELLAKQPLFNGEKEVRQLDKIFRTLGTPTEMTWPGFADLPGAKAKFVKQPRNTLRDKFPALSFKGSPVLSEQGFDLLSQLLTYDPDKRISVEAALQHRWFHGESEQELLATQESLSKKIKTLKYGFSR